MKDLKQLKIFVVDDDVMTTSVISQQLKNLGFTDVSPFNNELAFVDSLRFDPAIVFLDYQLDHIDGLELVKRIRRVKPGTYIVMLSAQMNVDVVVKCYNYGVFEYIVKGYDQEKKIGNVIEKITRDLLEKDNKGSSLHGILFDLFKP